MKKTLEQYRIGKCVGGSQDWFEDMWMNRGGCGAVTACECCIYLARQRGLTELYPFDAMNVTKGDFIAFGMQMKPFLSPRPRGINTTALFIEGFRAYLATRKGPVPALSGFQGSRDADEAAAVIRAQLDRGLPIPYLMLLHQDKALEDFFWHWFMLDGYDETDGRLMVRAFTYGETAWFDFGNLWDTGHEEKGGFVLLSLDPEA
ncbi:MAG: hypothetical protein IKQ10_00990 [Oscillospiraceae bacterium]|nr:hypothetical protein [Oscillospiraceae bacterium]